MIRYILKLLHKRRALVYRFEACQRQQRESLECLH